MRTHPQNSLIVQGACAAIVIVIGLCTSRAAHALAFQPTEAEWNTWPEHCQARYMVSAAGGDSPYVGRVPAALVQSWQARLGPEVWYSLHHYCAGMIIAARAKFQKTAKEREFLLRDAIEEFQFSLTRTPTTHPMHAEIAARKALAHRDLGEIDRAISILDSAISACTDCSAGYYAKAMIYRDNGQVTEARKVLEQGNRATEDKSPELHYLLGLVLADIKDYEAAQFQAREAYRLGYPQPGLRDRLARAGYAP